MTTAQKIQKLEKEVSELKSLFSALVPIDKEGVYKASFKGSLKRAASETTIGTISGRGSLLRLLK